MQHGNASTSSCQTFAARIRFFFFSNSSTAGTSTNDDFFETVCLHLRARGVQRRGPGLQGHPEDERGKSHTTLQHTDHTATHRRDGVVGLRRWVASLGCVVGVRRWGGRWVALLVCRLLVFMYSTGRHYARFSLGPFGSEKLESSLESSGASD